MPKVTTQRKRDEVSRGQRKLWREEDIREEKREHLLSVQVHLRKLDRFYSKDWDEEPQEEN